jgi:hypothetical protein
VQLSVSGQPNGDSLHPSARAVESPNPDMIQRQPLQQKRGDIIGRLLDFDMSAGFPPHFQ